MAAASKAKGIHAHDRFKLGRRAPKNAPALMLKDVLTGTVPAHAVSADHFRGQTFGLYGNDQFGDCGPVSVANLVRLVSGGLVGSEVQPSQDDVFDLYRRSGNPNFDPATGEGDNGVDMQTMLEALLQDGIAGVKPIAFAKVDVGSDGELDAAVAIFGGVLWGVTLQNAQQAQTDEDPPTWDYSRSAVWGGHAVLDGKYDEATRDAEVISWEMDVRTTPTFRAHQLDEAWVVVWEWNVDHPAFQEGVDLARLATAYRELTGRELPGTSDAPPEPQPGTSVDSADEALWAAVGRWAEDHHHYGGARIAAEQLRSWAAAKGLGG